MPRKPRQERAKATVAAIVEAGLIVLAQDGPKATSTRRIADVAGIGVGSLYEYFADREAIHAAMSERFVADAAAMVQPLIPALVRMPVREATYTLLCRAREFLERDDGRYLRCARHLPSMARTIPLRPLQKVLTDLSMQYLMRHPELAGARNIPAMTYIFIYGGLFTVIRHLSEEAPPVTFDELAHGLADMVAFSLQGSLAPAR